MSSDDLGNPYAPPGARIDDLEPQITGEPAPRGLRLGAAVIDLMLFVVPVALVSTFLYAFFNASHDAGVPSPFPAATVTALIGLSLAAIAVVNFVFVVRYQQTIGKRLCRIKVVRDDGSACNPWRIVLLRGLLTTLIGQIPLIGILFSLVDALMIFGEDRRCVHDYMADTRVVRS